MQTIPKDDWIATINKELKTKQWEQVFVQLTEELSVPPAYHFDDIKDQRWSPVGSYRNFDPLLGMDLLVEDSKEANHRLLHLLNGGLESPGVRCSPQWDGAINLLFDKVELDWLTWVIRDKTGTLAEFLGNKKVWMSETTHSSEDLHAVLDVFIRQLMVRSTPSEDSKLFFSVAIDRDYFKSIVLLRAMRRIHRNFTEALGMIYTPFFLDVSISPGTDFETEENKLIALTTMSMSALMGSADRIAFAQSGSQERSAFYDRMALNIMHILKMESNFTKVEDPLCGAFWVEKCTDLLAETYWKKLQSLEHALG